jgi:hypothetical protein
MDIYFVQAIALCKSLHYSSPIATAQKEKEMGTSHKTSCAVFKAYGFFNMQWYCRWRRNGFGMAESLRRIRDFQRAESRRLVAAK